MANPPFDAAKAVTFDLSRGQIQKEDEARLLVSASALVALCQAAGADATSAFALAPARSKRRAMAAPMDSPAAAPREAPTTIAKATATSRNRLRFDIIASRALQGYLVGSATPRDVRWRIRRSMLRKR